MSAKKYKLSCKGQVAGKRQTQFQPLLSSPKVTSSPRAAIGKRKNENTVTESLWDDATNDDQYIALGDNYEETEWARRAQTSSDRWDRDRRDIYEFLLAKDDERDICSCPIVKISEVKCVTLRGNYSFLR